MVREEGKKLYSDEGGRAGMVEGEGSIRGLKMDCVP